MPSIDDKIWNNEKEYFIEASDWVDGAVSKLPKGTELTRYSDTERVTTGFFFVSATGKWIQYK